MQLYSGNRIGRRSPGAEKTMMKIWRKENMSDNAWLALGLLVIVMVAAWALTRKARCNDKFDEMQLKIRSRGYQIGFFTALGLMMVLAFLLETGCITVVTPGLLALTALMISVTVFAVYCITHEAFLSIRGDGKNHILLYAVIIIVEIVNIVRHAVMGTMLENGKLEFGVGAGIVMCVCFAVILATLIVKKIRVGKEAENE